RLYAICRAADTPWRLSFSFSRALQGPVLAVWKGLPGNVLRAQAALYHRARCNSAATEGEYSSGMEVAGGSMWDGTTIWVFTAVTTGAPRWSAMASSSRRSPKSDWIVENTRPHQSCR